MTKHQCDGEKYIENRIDYLANGTTFRYYTFCCAKCQIAYDRYYICLVCSSEFTDLYGFMRHEKIHSSSTVNK